MNPTIINAIKTKNPMTHPTIIPTIFLSKTKKFGSVISEERVKEKEKNGN